jgi:hypothetical protein
MHPLLKEFTRKKVLSYARNIPEEGHIGPTLFPVVPVNELTFEYWQNLNLLPVSASLQAYGAEAQIASREGAQKVSGEIPPIKRKIYLDERNMLALKREGAGDVDMVRNELYNDIDNMVAAVYARIERLRMQILAAGQLVLQENGVQLNVNFGVPAAQQQPPAASWDDAANRTIIADIQAWAQLVEANTGVRPARALTSDTVANLMLTDQTIRDMIWGPVGDNRPVTWQEINRLLATMDLPQIATYNKRVRSQNEDGTYNTFRYFPADRFVLMPEGKLGDTLMGPTAEALLDDEVEAKNVAGIYANVTHENEPPMIWTKAAATSIPTFPAADLVYQAQVIF